MKNLKDYLPQRNRRKTLVEISESPILSPDTLDALQKAENLVKEAQKTILEASYDIASSSEREQSMRSPRQKEAEDEDAIYIRDIVATRFYEANESARIYTRPSTRPLAERLCRPMIRQRRARCARERSSKIYSEESTTSRPRSMQRPSTKVPKNPRIYSDQFDKEHKKHYQPQHTCSDDEIPTRISKDKDKSPSPWKIDNQNVANLFKVQQGPKIDIRNELTITNVEKVDISPQPRSSLPLQENIKTFEFQHESCVEKVVDNTKNLSEDASSIKCKSGDDIEAREPLEISEKSRDPTRKNRGSVTAPREQGSRSGLVENKSGQTISPEQLEGHANNVGTRIANQSELVVNEANNDNKVDEKNNKKDECFIDFLRRTGNSGNDDDNERLKHKIFGILDTNDKINIFDRAVEQFLGEFRPAERDQAKTNFPQSSERTQEKCLHEKEIDENFVDDARETDHLIDEEFYGDKYLEEVFDPEEIILQPPNIAHLEKSLSKFDSTMDKVIRGTRTLALLMSEYSIDEEVATRPGLMNKDCPDNPTLFHPANKDISRDVELKNVDHLDEKDMDNYENRNVKDTIKSCEELISSHENSNEISEASRYYTETKQEVEKKMKRVSSKKIDHPRFSTPLNNDLKITKPYGSNSDCKSNEFARFLIGIQRPRGLFESNEGPSSRNTDFARIERQTDNKILLNRNEFHPALSTLTRNDLELQKKTVIDEINKKCNFDTLFHRQLSNCEENKEKTHETQTFTNYPIRGERISSEMRNSETRSLIQDSAIGRVTEQSEKISIGTELINECSAKKDHSRSERYAQSEKDSKQFTTKKVNVTSEIESRNSKNMQSTKIKTVTMTNNSVESAQAVQKNERKLSTTLRPDICNNSKDNEGSVKDKETISNNNRQTDSSGSSLKDRTSFDISTVYSEDFEEPVVSAEKLKTEEKSESLKTTGLKSISKRVEIEEAKEKVEGNKSEDSKTVLTSSLEFKEIEKLCNVSKGETQYLEKSVTISASKMSDNVEEDKKGQSGGSKIIELVTEEKGTVECNSEIKEADEIQPEVSENPCRDERSTASTKVSGTSSIAGESRQEQVKLQKELNDDDVTGHSKLEHDIIPRYCFIPKGILGNVKECTNDIDAEPNNALKKSTSISSIETIVDDSLESEKDAEPCISAVQINEAKESDGSDKRVGKLNQSTKDFSIEKQEHLSNKSENKVYNERENVKQNKEVKLEYEKLVKQKSSQASGTNYEKNIDELYKSPKEFDSSPGQVYSEFSNKLEQFANFESSMAFHSTPKHIIPSESSETNNTKLHCLTKKAEDEKEMKISRNDNADKAINEIFLATDLDKVTNFASSIMINLSPKDLIENSNCTREEFFPSVSNPIPDDDHHANATADTCSENYSEGELYLPSSCSYSLGEIRISERGSYGTIGAAVIQSSARNADGMRIYFGEKNSNRHSSDNTIKAPNSQMQSPGEVQETDIESISSSRVVSSNGEHDMGTKYMQQLKLTDT